MTLSKTVLALAAALSLGAAHAQTITGQDILNDFTSNTNMLFIEFFVLWWCIFFQYDPFMYRYDTLI